MTDNPFSFDPEPEEESPARAPEPAPPYPTQPFGEIQIEARRAIVQPEDGAAVHMAATADDALRYALSRETHSVITGHLLAGDTFAVFSWSSEVTLGKPLVLAFEAAREVCLLVLNGEAVYVPSDPYQPTTRWVQVPRAREFYALAESDRNYQRQEWVHRLLAASASLSSLHPSLSESWLNSLSMPALRLLMAVNAGAVLAVWRIDQPDRGFRGAAVSFRDAVTLPLARYPVIEPDCYLPVIAGREGRLEAINAYDVDAGLSLGSLQFNAHGGALVRFLWMVWKHDPALFEEEFGGPFGWAMQPDGTHPDLLIAAGTAGETVLHGTDDDTAQVVGYLQSGEPGHGKFDEIDSAWREALTVRFRNAIAWPHVQELALNTSAWWLQPGVDIMHEARYGIPRLDSLSPDRDTYVLKALLLSAYVRYSICLRPFLEGLRRWETPDAKRAHWKAALNGAGAWGACTPTRRGRLQARLEQQEAEAEAVYDTLQRRMISGGA